MYSLPHTLLLFVIGIWHASLIAESVAEDSPAKQYSTLLRAYRPASGAFRDAKSDLDRKNAVQGMGEFAPKFLALAEKYPDDPIGLKALREAIQVSGSSDSGAQNAWEMNTEHLPNRSRDETAKGIVKSILQNHVTNKGLGPIVDRLRYGYRLEYENCLIEILKQNPAHDVKGLACLCLAQYLNDKLRMLQLAEVRPKLTKQYAEIFGTDYLDGLRKLRENKVEQRIESLFERAIREFGDVKFRNSTVGERAKSELYGVRNLSIGKLAPEISGQDQDGKEFKLSDYRGKVVLLYFWIEF
jgi:hypothetical protein